MNPKKNKLQRILAALSPDGTEVDFSQFDKAIEDLKSGLKEKVQAKTLEDVNTQLDSFRKRIDLTPLQEALKGIESGVDTKIKNIQSQLETELGNFQNANAADKDMSASQLIELGHSISDLKDSLANLQRQKDTEVKDMRDQFDQLPDIFKRIDAAITTAKTEAVTYRPDASKADLKLLTDLTDEVERMRLQLTNRINNIPRGGGNANRNIAVAGNTSVLSMFTDINLKPGNNVTFTYANNLVTKYLDLTISSTGGGGGSVVGGITRSISTVAVNTAAGSAQNTDYVYLASGNVTITLPTTVGNSNLYTVKNIGAGTVTVNTTGGETIDGSPNVIMPIQFTSVDLISNNSGNWDIT